MDKVTVFVEVGKETRTCEYGGKHNVTLVTKKFLYPTGETWLNDNGYEKTQQPVFKDAQGRVWKRYVTIDYSNNTSYLHGKYRGTHSMPYNGILV